MKKALVIIVLSIMALSAGFISPAGVSAAEATTEITAINLGSDGTIGSFSIARSDIEEVIVEFTFVKSGILMSMLITLDVNTVSTGMYTFTMPSGTKSFKIWRIITSFFGSKYETTPTGLSEFVNGSYSIANVQTRLKRIYINDDLITSETVVTAEGNAFIQSRQFNMYFNAEDSFGESIPIDKIYSIDFTYDVITTSFWGAFVSTETESVTIGETRTVPIGVWPFIVATDVIENITPAGDQFVDDDGNPFTWKTYIGTFNYTGFGGGVVIDETTMLSISYMYQGVFYDDVPVVDYPYQAEDIIDLTPPAASPWYIAILEWLSDNWKTIIYCVAGIIIATVLAKVFGLLTAIVTFIGDVLKAVFTGLGYVIKYLGIALGLLFKFLFYWLPIGIYRVLYFLFVPTKKRRQKQKRGVIVYDR